MYTHAHLCVPKHLSTAPPWNSALTSRAHSPGPTNKSPPGVKRCFAPVLRKGGTVTQYLTSHLGTCQHPGAIRGQGDFVGRFSCLLSTGYLGKPPSSCSSQPPLLFSKPVPATQRSPHKERRGRGMTMLQAPVPLRPGGPQPGGGPTPRHQLGPYRGGCSG